MDNIWIIAEQFDGVISSVSYELLRRAVTLSEEKKMSVTAVILGCDISTSELEKLTFYGADEVLYLNHPKLKNILFEPYAAILKELITTYQPQIILAAATSQGRTLMPYVAAKCHAGLTADCTELHIDAESGLLLQTRPAIGGNIMATIKTPHHTPQMATIRPNSTVVGRPDFNRKLTLKEIIPDENKLKSRVTCLDFTPHNEEHDLQESDIVVVVGRGIKKKENLKLIYEFADAIGAAVGASRDVIDRGWLSYPHQVGLSGKTITPKLYIGLGVSGAIQHLAGMQTSEYIIAVNKDKDAPIFKVANMGIVGDIFDVLPELLLLLKKESE